jgi:hypothetical protein
VSGSRLGLGVNLTAERLFRQLAIGLDDQQDGLSEVLSGLLKGRALGIGPRQLLNKGDVTTFRHFYENRCQLHSALPSSRGDDSFLARTPPIIA